LTIEAVIERAVRNAQERLGRATVPAPAYAVAIFSHDPDDLAAGNIVIGLERDREATLRNALQPDLPIALQNEEYAQALGTIWGPHFYRASGAIVPDEPQLVLTDPKFVEAQDAVLEELAAQGIWWHQRYLHNRVAQRLGSGTMPFEVTADFIVYAWDQDDEALEENIRFSARPETLAELERKGLI
jgi:hypothetical protein